MGCPRTRIISAVSSFMFAVSFSLEKLSLEMTLIATLGLTGKQPARTTQATVTTLHTATATPTCTATVTIRGGGRRFRRQAARECGHTNAEHGVELGNGGGSHSTTLPGSTALLPTHRRFHQPQSHDNLRADGTAHDGLQSRGAPVATAHRQPTQRYTPREKEKHQKMELAVDSGVRPPNNNQSGCSHPVTVTLRLSAC